MQRSPSGTWKPVGDVFPGLFLARCPVVSPTETDYFSENKSVREKSTPTVFCGLVQVANAVPWEQKPTVARQTRPIVHIVQSSALDFVFSKKRRDKNNAF